LDNLFLLKDGGVNTAITNSFTITGIMLATLSFTKARAALFAWE